MVGSFRAMIAEDGHAAAAAWLDAAPVVLARNAQGGPAGRRTVGPTSTLTPEEKIAASQLGLSEADVLAAKGS
jgi:phage I-like protein